MVATSAANDQLSAASLELSSLIFISQSGQSTTVPFTNMYPQYVPFSGHVQPLFTFNLPQGIYTSVTVNIPSIGFECVYQSKVSGQGQVYASFADTVPQGTVPVQLPAPISITGTNMELILNLNVSQSFSWSSGSCGSQSPSHATTSNFTAIPVLTLTSAAAQGNQASTQSSQFIGLFGQINSVASSTDSMNATLLEMSNYQIYFDQNTTYQGVSGFSSLVAGMPFDVDATLQSDGSLLASRIEVFDPNPASLSYMVSDLTSNGTAYSKYSGIASMAFLYDSGVLWGGAFGGSYVCLGCNFSTFDITGQFSNVQSLPFPASFTSANMVAGQRFFAASHDQTLIGHGPYNAATKVVLLPQTLDGTVSAIGSDGNFTTYTITLAPYDLFPQFAVQPGQTTLLTNPSQVVVYADNNTQMLNTNPIAVSDVVRFYGLVFNDNGTLRMDCAEIFDGVPE